MKTAVYYYVNAQGKSPIKDFIDSHPFSKPKVMRIIQTIRDYGLIPAIPHIKKFSGSPLWEIRILGQENVRIFYAAWNESGIVLLHAFIKKTQKTPSREIQLALNRLHELS